MFTSNPLPSNIDIPLDIDERLRTIVSSERWKRLRAQEAYSVKESRELRDTLILLLLVVNAQRNAVVTALRGYHIFRGRAS